MSGPIFQASSATLALLVAITILAAGLAGTPHIALLAIAVLLALLLALLLTIGLLLAITILLVPIALLAAFLALVHLIAVTIAAAWVLSTHRCSLHAYRPRG